MSMKQYSAGTSYICNIGMRDLPDMYTHKPKGMQPPRASVDISGKSWPHMLHMLYNTPGTLKICKPTFHCTACLFMMTGAVSGYGFLILTFA